jgi:hypothetical protein
MNLDNCIKKGFVKQIKVDKKRVRAIITTANSKEITENNIPFNNINSIAKITLRYSILRELLETLAILNNYKIYNHECYSAFLKQVLNESNLSNIFNKVRIARNSINYYGKSYTIEESKFILKNISTAIEKVKNLLNKHCF